ncbi:phosphatidyl ethanolamine-binding protein [Bodo saltans virus]|uniref:Phosphatidyl ethanolamine-binding protein n=1 Tax=Bodo saltans virus TaxID=2024608 RepID=A0A2H4UW43_9VIRU|nr:phosphatidyl ethanolamine-binding protein [Bodo saltans virus]ATZ81096.1 phosphatidyl ethanolamine-binding protein [Bodo saltans virus]
MNTLNIKFNGNIISNPNFIYDKKIFSEQPNINLNNDKNYTIMMIDRDAPILDKGKYWLHWLIVNTNETIVPYHPPTPPQKSGIHRYYILIFEQQQILNFVVQFERANFDMEKFVSEKKLKLVYKQRFKTQY